MASLRLKAPAKINLCLRVRGRREDGFHEIDSLFVKINFFDDLQISPRNDRDIRFSLAKPAPGVPADRSNIAWKAAQLFLERVPNCPGADIELAKNIPAGGGLGGGSSDAAQILIGLNSLAQEPMGAEALSALAAELGSDVPFFLGGTAARVRGRGERVEPVPPPGEGAFLLVFPGIHISTTWAYRSLGRGALTNEDLHSMLTCSGDLSRPVRAWARELHNDFEETVFTAHPRLRELRDLLSNRGALGIVMSGSGSTLVGVFDSEQTAREARDSFEKDGALVARPLDPVADSPGHFPDGA